MVAFGRILIVGEDKIEDAYGIDTLQLEVPFPAFGLLLNGEGGIEYAAVLEIVLLRLLHLHDEAFAGGVLTIDVEDGLAVFHPRAEVLGVAVFDVVYLLLALKKCIEEADEQFLVHLRTEELFEAEVGERVDVSLLVVVVFHNAC